MVLHQLCSPFPALRGKVATANDCSHTLFFFFWFILAFSAIKNENKHIFTRTREAFARSHGHVHKHRQTFVFGKFFDGGGLGAVGWLESRANERIENQGG